MSRLLSPCSFGCFLVVSWIPIKLKKLLQLLGLGNSIQGVSVTTCKYLLQCKKSVYFKYWDSFLAV